MALFTISYFHKMPNDILLYIGAFLSARQFVPLLQVSRNWRTLFRPVFYALANQERTRIRIIPFTAAPLNAFQAGDQWGHLNAEEARALRSNLEIQPLLFYSGVIEPAMIVLKEAFLAVKKNRDPQALSDFALGHIDILQGAIIANQIPSTMIRTVALCSLVNKAIETKLQLKTILEITQSIPDAATRSGTLRKIILQVEMPLETILTISRKILIDDSRINVLCKIILRIDTSMESTKAILNEISTIQTEQKDEILNIFALSNGLGFVKAFAIAHAIENPMKRSLTVFDVAIKYRLSKRKALKLTGQAFDE